MLIYFLQGGYMETQPTPNPSQPGPGPGQPIEVDPGTIHTRPEVDYGNEPMQPMQPEPETVPLPEKEPGPDIDPGH
jgi:hypothetical protein